MTVSPTARLMATQIGRASFSAAQHDDDECAVDRAIERHATTRMAAAAGLPPLDRGRERYAGSTAAATARSTASVAPAVDMAVLTNDPAAHIVLHAVEPASLGGAADTTGKGKGKGSGKDGGDGEGQGSGKDNGQGSGKDKGEGSGKDKGKGRPPAPDYAIAKKKEPAAHVSTSSARAAIACVSTERLNGRLKVLAARVLSFYCTPPPSAPLPLW